MPKFLIERTIPGLGALGPADLQAVSRKSCDVLAGLGTQIQWLESYVTADKLYCLYRAPSEELIREHARRAASRPKSGAGRRGRSHGDADRRRARAPGASGAGRDTPQPMISDPDPDSPAS